MSQAIFGVLVITAVIVLLVGIVARVVFGPGKNE